MGEKRYIKKDKKHLVKAISVIFVTMLLMNLSFSYTTQADLPSSKKRNENSEKQGLVSNPSFTENPNRVFSFQDLDLANLFVSDIHTNCSGINQDWRLPFGMPKEIDVDKNETTGKQGKDIRTHYVVLPWLELEPNPKIGVVFTLKVDVLNEEIKNKDLSVSLGMTDDFEIGYRSPSGSECETPDSVRISFMLLFSLKERKRGFGFSLIPEYKNSSVNDNGIVMFAKHTSQGKHREFTFELEPAIEFDSSLISTKKKGVWKYEFNRESTSSSKVTSTFTTMENGDKKATTLIIDEIPQNLSFSLGLTPLSEGGGQLVYGSDSVYDVELLVNSTELGVCRYAKLVETPNKITAKWTPTRENGSYSLNVKTKGNGTDFMLRDSLTDPAINLTVNDLQSIDVSTNWNLTNPGNLRVNKNSSVNLSLDFNIQDWKAKVEAQPEAENITVNWFINTSGHLQYDTDWKSMNEISVLVRGSDIGFRTNAETFKADDWKVLWTIWPPAEWNIKTEGRRDCIELDVDIYYQGVWNNIWPIPT